MFSYKAIIWILLVATQVFANPVLLEDKESLPVTQAVEESGPAEILSPVEKVQLTKDELLTHDPEYPVKEPLYTTPVVEVIEDKVKAYSLESPQTIEAPQILHDQNPAQVVEGTKFIPGTLELIELPEEESDPLQEDQVEPPPGHKNVPEIIVTSPTRYEPPSTFYPAQFFDKFQLPQTGFEHVRNTFQVHKLPLPSFPIQKFHQPITSFQTKPVHPYEKEFDDRSGGRLGKFSQDTPLAVEAVKITKLIGGLKQRIKEVLVEWVEEDFNGKNAINVCKLSQSRLVLSSTADAFFTSIGHFVKLDSGDGDIDCRLKAYRALRTLEDALADIRNGIPEQAASRLQPYWHDLSIAISESLNAITRKSV